MPKITPAIRPGTSVPSRSNILAPRSRAITSSARIAPEERISACSIGGMSGSAGLAATWLNPQLRHRSGTSAIAPGVRGRAASRRSKDMNPRGRLAAALLLLAMRAGAGDLDDRQFWRKAGGARGLVEALRKTGSGNFADRTTALADQKGNHRRCIVVMRAGEKRVAAFDAVDETVVDQKIQRPVYRDRRRPRH